jgi:hypothetical protein
MVGVQLLDDGQYFNCCLDGIVLTKLVPDNAVHQLVYKLACTTNDQACSSLHYNLVRYKRSLIEVQPVYGLVLAQARHTLLVGCRTGSIRGCRLLGDTSIVHLKNCTLYC